MPAPNLVSVTQLARLIGTAEAPVLLDLCLPEDFAADPHIIPGSRRAAHDGLTALLPKLSGRRIVTICQRGRKISQGAAALLRSHGLAAEALDGGVLAWAEAGLPRIPVAALPARHDDGATHWVTRHRPKVERIACPWLIRRFIDPAARFLFVAPAEVLAVAERFDATPFDAEAAPFSHQGDRCTFDALLEHFDLRLPALECLADCVRGADSGRLDIAPQSAGLLALSLGLSRMYRSDTEQLEAGMLLYDALYRWARDARDETHAWDGSHGPAR